MEEDNNPNYALWAIFGALVTIIFVLFSIKGILQDIYSDTHYTSASADYLKDIKDLLESK